MFAKTFSKTLTAGVLSITLAMTSLAPTKASAEFSDGDAVVGIITLLLLGAAIHNRNDDASVRNERAPAPRSRNVDRNLPVECLRRVYTRNGDTVRMFTQRCLARVYGPINRLPQSCHVQVRAANGEIKRGFRQNCMHNAGFRTDRR